MILRYRLLKVVSFALLLTFLVPSVALPLQVEITDISDDRYFEVVHEERKEPYLFLNRYGRRCTPDKVREYLKRTSRVVIGTEITPHYFRHRFLTECGKANVPIVDVMAISGIKDIKVIVKHYSHSTEEGQTKVLEVTRVL